MKVAAKAYLARKPDLVYTDKGTAIWKTAVAVQGREREEGGPGAHGGPPADRDLRGQGGR
jgi:hypothetical protein